MNKILIKLYGLYLARKHKMSNWGGRVLADVFLRDFKKSTLSFKEIVKIHDKGFSLEDWIFCKINEKNYCTYLSSAQYMSLHPINGEYSKSIDSKLALKDLCVNTHMNKYLPEYYFKIDKNGKVVVLSECPIEYKSAKAESIISLLETKKELAIKLVTGSLGEGFIKAEFKDGNYILNGKQLDKDTCLKRIQDLRNYLITEYLKPHADIAKIFPYTTNTIRYLVGVDNGDIIIIKKHIRFGTMNSNFVDNYAAGGVLCFIDDNGYFAIGNVINEDKRSNKEITHHPDTGSLLNGVVPLWNSIENISKEFCKTFPEFKYLGFDYVVTDDNKIKILEINSLTSLDTLQLDGSILRGKIGHFFSNLLENK